MVTPPTPASAGVLDVSCIPPSNQLNTYNPPLTLTPATVIVTSSAHYTCLSHSAPTLTSGSRTIEVSSPGRSCLDLLTGFANTQTITWNTGQTSTATVATLGATHIVTVTSGLFTGDTVVQTTTSPSAPILLCTLGLSTVSTTTSTVLLEITTT